MKKATNRQELADTTLSIASEAIHALNYAIQGGELGVRDLNAIATSMGKLHRDLVSDLRAEQKEMLEDKSEDSQEEEAHKFGSTIANLLDNVKQAGS